MKPYYFPALTAFLGLAFLAGAIAAALARRTVHNWYRNMQQPQNVPPPPAFSWAWVSTYLVLGAAAWVVWLNVPRWSDPRVRLGLILYFVTLGLHAVWSGVLFRLDRPGAAFALAVAEWLATLATLIIFWRVAILPGALLILPLLWTAYVAFTNLKWWRHGGHLAGREPQPAAPTQLAA